MRLGISPDGYVNIDNVGPVFLSNMTIKEARQLLKQELGKIYADSGNNIQVTLGNIRTIQVNVMGGSDGTGHVCAVVALDGVSCAVRGGRCERHR